MWAEVNIRLLSLIITCEEIIINMLLPCVVKCVFIFHIQLPIIILVLFDNFYKFQRSRQNFKKNLHMYEKYNFSSLPIVSHTSICASCQNSKIFITKRNCNCFQIPLKMDILLVHITKLISSISHTPLTESSFLWSLQYQPHGKHYNLHVLLNSYF